MASVLGRAAVALAVASCTPPSLRVSPADPRVRREGVFDTRRMDAPRFAWSAAGATLRFRGTGLRVELTDVPNPDDTPDTDWLSVTVDAQPPRALALRRGRHVYTLAERLAPGDHVVRFRKRTEPEVGTVTLHGFELAPGGRLLAPPTRGRRLRVIGDSVSAGYGVEGAGGACHFSAATEDATRAYAAVASELLGAELILAAWSGKGVVQNFAADGRETMPALFARAIPGEPEGPRADVGPVDALVVNLGTNDYHRSLPDAGVLAARLRSLLTEAEREAAGAPTVLVLTPLLADDHPRSGARTHLRGVLAGLVAEAPTRRSLVEQYVDPREGVGCDFHPSARTHERLGRELAAHLTALLRPDR